MWLALFTHLKIHLILSGNIHFSDFTKMKGSVIFISADRNFLYGLISKNNQD